MTTQEFNSEYRVIGSKDEPIAEGAYGRVFKSYRLRDSLAVAVKIVDIKKEKLSGFNNERDILALVSRGGDEETKHICKIIGIYTDSREKHEAKIVMPLMGGGDLRGYYTNVLRNRGNQSLTEDRVHYLFKQIVSGMKYLHRLNICHRDLKPENILIEKPYGITSNPDVVLKIADFGVAAYFDENVKFSKTAGTLGYVAPEILAKKNYDDKCDIWSLGIMMMEAIGLYNLEKLGNFSTYDSRETTEELELMFPPATTMRFMNLMHKALKRNPDDRISVDDFLNDDYFILPYCNKAPAPLLAHALQGLQIQPPRAPAEPVKVCDRTKNLGAHAQKKN